MHVHAIRGTEPEAGQRPPPESVAILGMGPSYRSFVAKTINDGSPAESFDEVWGINNIATVVRCDLAFIMDDFKEMLEKPHKDALLWDKSNPGLMRWCRTAPMPIYTSRAYADYPTTIEYPLEDVIQALGLYGFNLNNSTAYAIAYAWMIGVKRIEPFGCDFAYPHNDPWDRRKFMEEARACVEGLLLCGMKTGRFQCVLPQDTSLFDTISGRKFYGYADGRDAMRYVKDLEKGEDKNGSE